MIIKRFFMLCLVGLQLSSLGGTSLRQQEQRVYTLLAGAGGAAVAASRIPHPAARVLGALGIMGSGMLALNAATFFALARGS